METYLDLDDTNVDGVHPSSLPTVLKYPALKPPVKAGFVRSGGRGRRAFNFLIEPRGYGGIRSWSRGGTVGLQNLTAVEAPAALLIQHLAGNRTLVAPRIHRRSINPGAESMIVRRRVLVTFE